MFANNIYKQVQLLYINVLNLKVFDNVCNNVNLENITKLWSANFERLRTKEKNFPIEYFVGSWGYQILFDQNIAREYEVSFLTPYTFSTRIFTLLENSSTGSLNYNTFLSFHNLHKIMIKFKNQFFIQLVCNSYLLPSLFYQDLLFYSTFHSSRKHIAVIQYFVL